VRWGGVPPPGPASGRAPRGASGPSTRRAATALLAAALLAAGGCTLLHPGSEGDRLFAAGAYGEAAAAYREALYRDQAADRQAHTLFRLGLAYALPASKIHDWDLARQYLGRVADGFPSTPEGQEARLLLDLDHDATRLAAEAADARSRATTAEAEADRLRGDLATATGAGRQNDERMRRLTSDLEATRQRLAQLAAELAALKKIDAETPP
jgi:hypothetical protein